MDELSVGQQLSGKVKSITQFGVFVDIGVGKDGLIHVSQMQGREVCQGDHVQVQVISIEHGRGRIGLTLVG